MKKAIIAIASSLALFTVNAQQNEETLQQTTSWSETLQKAKQQGKLIFVDCYFTGCHPCAQMDKEVFPNEQVRKELNESFVAIKVDVFKEKLGDTINMKYGITGFPTFLILNQQGQLVSMFSGYKDAGLLLNELSAAKKKSSKKNVLTGFAIGNKIEYEQFYKDYYSREERKSDPVAANAWIKKQNDQTAEPVAMAIFRTGKLDAEIEMFFLENYNKYLEKYGEALATGKANTILAAQLDKATDKKKDEEQFRAFLSNKATLFPKDEWRVLNFLLGYKYYGSIAKDTAGLLNFINEDPLVYANYIGALYSSMIVKKQLNESTLPLLCQWASKAVNEEAAFDMIELAASFCKRNNDMASYRKFISIAMSKAKKYNVSFERYEKMLAAN
ncbi:MAG TPA: DUF255 domain-containing protein [Chitinophagaceae bacterium]